MQTDSDEITSQNEMAFASEMWTHQPRGEGGILVALIRHRRCARVQHRLCTEQKTCKIFNEHVCNKPRMLGVVVQNQPIMMFEQESAIVV